MKYFYLTTDMNYVERKMFFTENDIFIIEYLDPQILIIAPFDRAEDIGRLGRAVRGNVYCEVTEAAYEDVEQYL